MRHYSFTRTEKSKRPVNVHLKLTLKPGAPVIIDPPLALQWNKGEWSSDLPNSLEILIATGHRTGDLAMVSWIPVIASDTGLPLQSKRIQYLIRLAFAMTINKAQRQSMSVVGLNTSTSPTPSEAVFPPKLFLNLCDKGIRIYLFSHGQFYVGVSRVGSPASSSCERKDPMHKT